MAVKFFKKRRTKLPKLGAVPRLIQRRFDGPTQQRYQRELNECPSLPQIIREVTLARPDPNKRTNMAFYPDLKNFALYSTPNRSIPVQKFLDLFRNMVPQETLDKLEHDLTNFRLEMHTQPEEWMRVYADDTVYSCMTGRSVVRCYCHPENDLALATLYAPGSKKVVARTIVNTELKWYVRLFGDPLLVSKLNELGYHKLQGPPPEFRMYAQIPGDRYKENHLQYPYFDFEATKVDVLHHTQNMETGLVEIIVNAI